MVVYDIETFNTIKCVPYCNCTKRLCKVSRKYNGDISEKEFQKCKKYCIVFKRLDNINEMGRLDYVLKFNGESKKNNFKLVC